MRTARCNLDYIAEGVLQFSTLECGGDEGIRTLDPLLAGQVLSQLSYTPLFNTPKFPAGVEISGTPLRRP